jgi:hypothetical protein
MYYKVDTRYIPSLLLKRDIPKLDAACLEDLQALKNE